MNFKINIKLKIKEVKILRTTDVNILPIFLTMVII